MSLATNHECDAIIIILLLRAEKNLAVGTLVKDIFHARSDKTDVPGPNFHKKYIDVLEERISEKDLEGSN